MFPRWLGPAASGPLDREAPVMAGRGFLLLLTPLFDGVGNMRSQQGAVICVG